MTIEMELTEDAGDMKLISGFGITIDWFKG